MGLTTPTYGFRYPKITQITNLHDARQNGGFTLAVEREGSYGSCVLETYVQCLVGNRGEQLDYVSPKDSRWKKVPSPAISGSTAGGFTVKVSSSNIIDLFGSRAYEEVLLTKRAIHFAVFEKITCSYTGLTDIYFRIEGKQVVARSLKNQAISDKYYSVGSKVSTLGGGDFPSTINRVVVDLAERIDSNAMRETRSVYVSSGKKIYGFDYYSGAKIAESSSYEVLINAISVDPSTGIVWFVVPGATGKVNVIGIKPDGKGGFDEQKTFSIKPGRTKSEGISVPVNGTKDDIAKRITGGVISRGAGKKFWFSFIVDKDSVISVCVSNSGTVAGYRYGDWYVLDRMHFGAWHGKNAFPCPETLKLTGSGRAYYTYKPDKEYGIPKGTDNIQGICNGIGSAVYVNGHTYYHEDWRYWNDVIITGWTTKGARCGDNEFTESFYYPSYVLNEDGTFMKDPSNSSLYAVVKKEVHELGYPVDDLWLKFDSSRSGKVAKSYDPDHETGDSTHCDFGYSKGKYSLPYNPNIKTSGAFKNVKDVEYCWDGSPQIDYEKLKPHNDPAHMVYQDNSYTYAKGDHWYQLQDLGFVYGANASLMQPGKSYPTGTNALHYWSSTANNAQLYFSNGVCEDNPSQITDVTVETTANSSTVSLFNFNGYREKSNVILSRDTDKEYMSKRGDWVVSGVHGKNVKGFGYQKDLRVTPSHTSNYFDAMCPVGGEQTSRFPVETYGWRGKYGTHSPHVWGFSEDWGINKAGYTFAETGWSCEKAPRAPRMSMYGMECRLNADGNLQASNGFSKDEYGEIIQTNYDQGVAYILTYTKTGSNSLHRSHSVDSSKVTGLTKVCGVCIDDTNRLFFEKDEASSAKVVSTLPSDAQSRFKYRNPYASDLKQFTIFGNHNNSYQTIEACCLAYGGQFSYKTAREKILAEGITTVATNVQDKYILSTGNFDFGNGNHGGQFNQDNTGMGAIKALGYCYTLRTQAHPLPVAPKGRLVITESRVRQEKNCYETEIGKDFWQKSVIQPTTYDEIKGTLNSTDNFTQIESAPVQRDTLYIHMGNATDKDAAMAEKFGLSAAGYDHFATKHLLDVFTTGSYAPDEFILEYRDAEERNRDANKHSTFKSFYAGTDITSANNGFYVNYEAPDAWDAITVYGKPIKTETTNGDTAKLYRWGQNTPYEKYTATDTLRYSSVHPDVYVNTKAEVDGMTDKSWAWVENNDKAHTKPKSVQNPRYGYSDANSVSFSAVSYDYPYGNSEIPGSDSITFYFGKNFVHVYERWSTPAMCATSDDPSGGLSLWGECEQ